MELEIGAVVEGKVTGITNFGAFVALPEGKSGLVHISEIANSYVNNISDHISVGQTVKVKILSAADGKINLSIKRASEINTSASVSNRTAADTRRKFSADSMPQQSSVAPPPNASYKNAAAADQSFEDKLKRFMQESDSKIADNKFYSDHKQRSRKR